MYENENNSVIADVIIKDETIWMTQKQMAELFEVDRTTISRHLNNIFSDPVLDIELACAKIAHATQHAWCN
ncbi:hypothetical protein ACWOB1_01590 [Facklamia languida]|uniref:hypothetical protein n=1 Tax=Facklamia languida TaxID=82347 RepID=UPI00058E34AD|nr:hypothetical protein [Facklamia languida]